MKNNAHIESKTRRLQRLTQNPPVEAIETLLNSISNFFNNEISLTPTYHQTSLLFLGIHAASLTISEALFDKKGEAGFRTFLKVFVDGPTEGTSFSQISNILHDWRNILAHQWIGSMGHEIEYDYQMTEGWKIDEGGIKINPRIYCDRYLAAFSAGGKIWKYNSILPESELEKAKWRIVAKYERK